MSTSTRKRLVAVGLITNVINIDNYNYAIYSKTVFPTDITIEVYENVDGSELLNLPGVGDISGATGSSLGISGQISYSLPFSTNITGSTYPTG